jgi:hypothetical protein
MRWEAQANRDLLKTQWIIWKNIMNNVIQFFYNASNNKKQIARIKNIVKMA